MALKKDKIIDYIKNSNYNKKNILIEIYNESKLEFDNDILFDIIKIIIDEDSFGIHDETIIKQAKELFYLMNIDKNNEDDYRIFLNLFRLDINIEVVKKILKMFNDKNNLLFLVDELKKLPEETINYVTDYIVEARRYYVDEKAFLSSIITLINKLINFNTGIYNCDTMDVIVDDQLNQDKYLSGLNDSETQRYSLSLEDMNKKYEDLKKEYNELLLDKEDITIINNDNFLSELERSAIYIIEDIAETIKQHGFKSSNLKKQNEIKKILKDKIVFVLKGMDSLNLEEVEKNYFTYYYMALYNNTMDIFELLKDKINFNYLFNLKKLDREFISNFDKSTYLDLVVNRNSFLSRIIEEENISVYVQLLNINPEFNDSYRNYNGQMSEYYTKLIKIFGIDKVAEEDSDFVRTIKGMNEQNWSIYKELLDINPNFVFAENYNSYYLFNSKYPIEKYAILDYKHQFVVNFIYEHGNELFKNQKILEEVVEILCNYDLKKDVDTFKGHLFENKRLEETYKIYLINETYQMLIDKKLNITPKEYFNLDYDTQVIINRHYYNHHKYIFPTLPVDGKIKRIVKHNK